MKVRGVERLLSARGETTVDNVQFGSNDDQLEFEFAAPSFRNADSLLYQYRVEGTRSESWSALSAAKSVNFASLPPGSYRFLVRAVDAHGVETPPAAVRFRILPPIWATWWFRTLGALAAAAIVYALYRYRLATILERERLRFRIATDLHDDIGSSLTSIAIWSDVAVRQAETTDSELVPSLQRIGSVSREVIDSVSDIVWAINPHHDTFADLTSRMRRHAGDLAAALQMPISITTDGEEPDLSVGSGFRREVFLIFKEALNNAVRHSECTECAASLVFRPQAMTVRIFDNGKGIDPNRRSEGHGLESMQKRAQRLGGICRITSAASRGTTVEFQVPVPRERPRLWRRNLHK